MDTMTFKHAGEVVSEWVAASQNVKSASVAMDDQEVLSISVITEGRGLVREIPAQIRALLELPVKVQMDQITYN